MLATVALATMYQPVGITFGAILGHGLATLLAIVGGNLASRVISDRVINIIGGITFTSFAALYYLGIITIGLGGGA